MPLRHDINFLIGLSSTQQTAEEKAFVVRYHRDYIYAPLRAALEPEVHAVLKLRAEQMHYEATLPMTPISRELDAPREAHILVRGQYDKPGERVEPGTPAFLPPIEKSDIPLARRSPLANAANFDPSGWYAAVPSPDTAISSRNTG